ncbi:BamA/TamA family outer membrane protein [Echinicola jeungdonensis]|uniref:BamA/TamA family outer membrane protein n=1 Tax=Echinicola jeungdonensis TaxID=709343 RepID=A0ABV5J5S8_9BACT|nr:BamA/TamA family outer membrane protein [Echinicola jeungdonensis]MDN3671000.1 BamA/TamA family outer membrane protein [Echinicola jeungdonensis]
MNKFKYINFLLALLLLSSCSLTKGLKEGEHLVYEVEVTGVEQNNEDDIKELITQTPNTRVPLFNFSPGVFIYNLGKIGYDSLRLAQKKDEIQNQLQEVQAKLEEDPQKNKWYRKFNRLNSRIEGLNKKLEYGNWFMRTGNPNVIYDSVKTYQSQEQIQFYLENHGNFDAKVTTEVNKKNKKAFITYNVSEGTPYVIDSIFTRSGDENIYKLLGQHQENRLIREGHIYNQNNLRKERQRVEDILKNNGYYTFSKSYIAYNVYKDTLENKVTVEQVIRKPTYAENHKVYTVDSILFSIDSPNDLILDEEVKFQHEGITFQMYRDRYSEKILDSRIFLKKGALYNRSEVLETQRQLANLDIFRFVNIAFDTLGNSITAKIFTKPNEKYQITNQLGASITEQLPGPFFSHSLRNRNLFRGLEIFEFNFRAGLEGVASATTEGGVYRSRELSTSASILFPQFLFPFNDWALKAFGRYNPRTRTLLGYNYVNRPEYARESFNTIFAYNWATSNQRHQFTVSWLDANFIRSNLDPAFEDRLLELQSLGNNLINSFESSYVSSISGQVIINFNEYGIYQRDRASLWRLFLEGGGTMLNFINTEFLEARSLSHFQFLKFQSDFRRYLPINRKSTFAYRLNFGLAYPYGISEGVLPYEKYYFAGGSTSIRAWQPRRLGPGSYTPEITSDGSFDYRFEQPGNILFEAMLEYRRKLFGYFDGAFFIDAGNIWTIKKDPTREGAQIQPESFIQDIAIGTGIGLRMDFDFLVLRLDMGIKAIDPARPLGERFILDNLSFQNPLGEKGQTVFNIGIGYPF